MTQVYTKTGLWSDLFNYLKIAADLTILKFITFTVSTLLKSYFTVAFSVKNIIYRLHLLLKSTTENSFEVSTLI